MFLVKIRNNFVGSGDLRNSTKYRRTNNDISNKHDSIITSEAFKEDNKEHDHLLGRDAV